MIKEIREYYNFLLSVQDRQKKRLDEIKPLSLYKLKLKLTKNNNGFYSVKKPGDSNYKYLGGKSNEKVRQICEARYLSVSLKILGKDLALIKKLLDKYESISFGHVINKLPKAYKNVKTKAPKSGKEIAEEWKTKQEAYKATFKPYKPEELIHVTVDGTKVRSKSEQSIYNYLFEGGYTFVYELPVKGKTRMFFPDFAILSEIDYKTVIKLEHQGKYGDDDYRASANERQYDYWLSEILPGRDVYFTFDDCKGGFDIRPVIEIIKCRVRPDTKAANEEDKRS